MGLCLTIHPTIQPFSHAFPVCHLGGGKNITDLGSTSATNGGPSADLSSGSGAAGSSRSGPGSGGGSGGGGTKFMVKPDPAVAQRQSKIDRLIQQGLLTKSGAAGNAAGFQLIKAEEPSQPAAAGTSILQQCECQTRHSCDGLWLV